METVRVTLAEFERGLKIGSSQMKNGQPWMRIHRGRDFPLVRVEIITDWTECDLLAPTPDNNFPGGV